MIGFMEWLAEHGIESLALIIAFISMCITIAANKKADKAKQKAEETEAELQRIKEDFDASDRYGQVKLVERLFEDALTELVVVTDKESEASQEDIKRALLTAVNRYTNLYNEINSFCKLINNGAIKAEKYLKDTAYQKLEDHADLQWKYYAQLNEIANDNQIHKLLRPRYKAFSAYDEFLEKHLYKDRWMNMKAKRKEVGME